MRLRDDRRRVARWFEQQRCQVAQFADDRFERRPVAAVDIVVDAIGHRATVPHQALAQRG